MTCRTVLLISVSAFALLAGCAKTNISNNEAELTAAAARNALVEMLEQTDDTDIRRYLEPLKGTEPETEDDGKIAKFGPLTCYIPERRFVLSIVSVDGRDFIEWTGTFVRQGGRWIAKVEEKRQT